MNVTRWKLETGLLFLLRGGYDFQNLGYRFLYDFYQKEWDEIFIFFFFFSLDFLLKGREEHDLKELEDNSFVDDVVAHLVSRQRMWFQC